jgi:DUF1680 family protein
MHVKTLQLNLQVGQRIKLGKHDTVAEITKIEYFPKSGEIEINTTRGPRKALTFKLLQPESNDPECSADKYR